MVVRTAQALLENTLTTGGINRLSSYSRALGSNTTLLNSAAMVFRSAMALRPLVSVPAIDGNLASWSVMLPNSVTRSAIWVVLAARVSVAGLAAASRSLISSFFALIVSARSDVRLIASPI